MTEQAQPSQTGPAVQQPSQGINKKNVQEETLTKVLDRIDAMRKTGELMIPDNYSPENALRNAWFFIKEAKDRNDVPALECCSADSIILALLKMVVNGVTPVKKQCYFIVRGKTLCCDISYFGNYAIAKRVTDIIDVVANCIYGKDTFTYKIDHITGRKTVVEHLQDFLNINDDDLKGAYATITFANGSTKVEIMNMLQIKKAWNMGAAKGNSPAHNNFPGEMAKRTVINRILKAEIGSSDDEDLFDNEDNFRKDYTSERVQREIFSNGNKTALSIGDSIKEKESKQTLNINANENKVHPEVISMPVQDENESGSEGPGY